MENLFVEMKRYVRFGPEDEAALRGLHPHAAPHFRRLAEEWYARLEEHPEALTVFASPEQVARLKGTMVEWLGSLLLGPWDDAYYAHRVRIGQTHVRVALPQRYMLGAMCLIRLSLQQIGRAAIPDQDVRITTTLAVAKILDLELAIMLDSYREAYVDRVQELERLEKSLLERRLAISEARYDEIVETAEALICTCDGDGRILLFNRRCEQVSGLPRQQAGGRPFTDIFVGVPEERERVAARCKDVLAGKRVAPYEAIALSDRGLEHRVRWHFTVLPGDPAPIMCAIGVDVTGEHELAVRTRRAERLASLGTMAAGLAHEIRNPLNAAHLQLTLLTRRLGRAAADVPGALAAADLAGSEMKRLAALVEEFLQFARPQPLRLSRVDLRATAEVIVSLVAPEAEAAGVELVLAAGAPVSAEVDDERIKQVLLNLVRNAVEAAGRGGRVAVRAALADGHAVLEVEDDGPGLPSPEAPIFEPFYTTKVAGTGLGLAIVHRIVTDHGGRISVDSRPGRTVFSAALPAL